MKTLANILGRIILLPNLPFILIAGIYVTYITIKRVGVMEWLSTADDRVTKEEHAFFKSVYPEKLLYIIAISFYTWLLYKILI
ncbi:hypothetical protein Harreka1_70 [Olleya phage Harreka_1]|uniref:Uncharacterized protein n=1 Tax=Olleya phage Harreka_1 TaxID=2745673 RepID=A0A8E5EBJ5_9CAUD|nr:hypothetical protein M1M26_gp70 [Olleya phage Harreka_1]QQV90477.1 hypothetical protein Harreka1_70 [Olleya phage Harreka_1]